MPKCACSTAKLHLHELQTGAPYKRAPGGASVHRHYPSQPFADLPHEKLNDHLKIAIVRGPVSRILSAYQNKIVKDGCLHRFKTAWACRLRRLPLDPDIDTFLNRLDDYRRVCRIIRSHSEPLSHFLGEDPNWFDHLISIRHLDVFEDITASRAGVHVPLGHKNKSSSRLRPIDLDGHMRKALRDRYQSDFDLFGAYFNKDADPRGLTGKGGAG